MTYNVFGGTLNLTQPNPTLFFFHHCLTSFDVIYKISENPNLKTM